MRALRTIASVTPRADAPYSTCVSRPVHPLVTPLPIDSGSLVL
jgi:hypothetical protein